jgi:hypothetical protein
MLNALKWLGLVLAGLVGLVLLVYVVSRLMPIPEDEARALAMLDAPRELEGRNGYAALWAIRHDVPEAELEQRLAEAVRDFGARPAWDGIGELPAEPTLIGKYPLLDTKVPAEVSLCSAQEAGCLQKVRTSLAVVGPVVESRAALSARISALDGYDYFLSPFPSRLDTPFPAYQVLTRDLTSHAHAFAQGDVEGGLAGVCRSASIGRKLVASGDNLIGSMIGVALMKGAGALFVDMLAELPIDHPVPAQCRQVFTSDVAMAEGVCRVMLGEGRYVIGGMRAMNLPQSGEWYAPHAFDLEKTAAINARRFTWFCGAEAAGMLERDQPLIIPSASPVRWSLRCAANPIGCILADIAMPAYRDYGLRLQDAEARQRLVATWLWLRDNPDRSRALAERLASRPAALKSPSRDVEVVEGGKALQVRMYDATREPVWQLPLPAWLQDAPGAQAQPAR